jgi:amino acid transporter
MEVFGGILAIFAIIWVIGLILCLVISAVLTLFGLFKQTTSGASALFSRASTELGFLGVAILFICWGTVPIVMVIACTLIGIFSETGSDDDDILKISDDKLYKDEPLSEYEKKRGF